MTKATELTIRAQAAVKYPGWRVDITGPATAVLTNVMGRRRVIDVKRRRRRRNGPWMRLAKWIVPAVMWLLGMWMVSMAVMMMALGTGF